ncbi:MAG TPA: transposase [Methylomirabilota bacterium]|nr:transposase [Methylomirabilota bacterium]
MSDPTGNPDHSSNLHLGKFAPGADSQPRTTADETSATVIIKRAASETVKQSGAPILSRDSGPLPPQEMLGAVSYCYAKGVYSAEEIEDKMLRDPQMHDALHGEVPDADAIRRFRRLNRNAIKRTLEKAFVFLRKRQPRPAIEPLPGQPATGHSPQPVEGETTVTFARHQAEKKIDEAAFIDNMSKD